MDAETRAEIERRVCERINESDPYRFAWIGAVDDDGACVEPRAAAGVESGYLDAIEITLDGGDPAGPTARAYQTGELAVMQDIPADPAYERWRADAIERGYRSSAAIPLRHGETLYGVLNVYADRTHAFDEREQALLAELGDTVGHAIRRVEPRTDLERRLRRFESAVEHAGHVVLITDADATIRYVNDAFESVTGYTASEAVGRTPAMLQSGEHGREFYRDLWETILAGDVWQGEVINERKDGERYVIDQTIAPITDSDGESTGFVAINRDITDIKQYERELEAQNERLKQYGETVAHDLRNPLTPLYGEVERLRGAIADGDLDAERVRERCDSIDEIVRRMEALIDDLLTMAEQGQLVLNPEAVSLESVATAAWAQIEAPNASLAVESTPIQADHDRVIEMLSNLFRNAVEHGGANVHVRVGPLDFEEGFFVADDGPGVPAEERDRVLDRGYTTDENGTGFGLAIVAQIAHAHGWSVSVTESRNGGARFEFRSEED